MCYAIPGIIDEINGNQVVVDYFGEKRRCRNDFYELKVGEYVLAQGGFIIERVSPVEAEAILETWKELFFKLQEVDLRLAKEPKNLRETANSLRQRSCGNACCVHGILEFSNYCTQDCLYCGLRRSNSAIERYRMDVPQIIDAAEYAIKELKFKALVLQSGEDLWYDEEKLAQIVRGILQRSPALLIMSIGEREPGVYERLFKEGARAALLRFETGDASLYERMRPGKHLLDRLSLVKKLRDMGYLLMTGFLVGLPGQAQEDVLKDIELASSLGLDMFSCGPFIPHPQTPLGQENAPGWDQAVDTIARIRIMNPDAKILVTTSLETLNKDDGLRQGLLAGGNSLMVNVTPAQYQQLYELYPERAGVNVDMKQRIKYLVELLHSIGRAPVDIGL
jgi:biotin synthase